MEAITKRFIVPVTPTTSVKLPVVYPWEQTNLFVLCQQLYELASKTGYTGGFDEFKEHFGEYLNSDGSLINYDIYTGQYEITALPEVEQILRTEKKILLADIVVKPIPYYEVTNDAGGITVSIG